MRFSRLYPMFVLTIAAVMGFSTAVSAAPTVRIGGYSLRANGQVAQGFKYTGSCPVDLQFGWGVIATAPTAVKYTFVRSDGGRSSGSMTANIPAANQSVPIYVDWHLGANNAQFANFSGWVELQIEEPNKVTQRIPMEIHCVGPTVRIGGYSLRANGQVAQGFKYTGSCPVDLQFGWGVIATAPTAVKYTFVRSDGGRSSNSMTANIPAANQSVPIYVDWHLGANNAQFANFSGWVELQIEEPNKVTQRIPMEIHCVGPTVRVGGYSLRANGQVAQGFKYAGSCPVDLQFGWGVIATAPTAVKYTFVRSDGGRSSGSMTANIPAANQSVPIYVDWRLGANNAQFANFSGWVELQIEEPNKSVQKIEFTIHCAGRPEKPLPGNGPTRPSRPS